MTYGQCSDFIYGEKRYPRIGKPYQGLGIGTMLMERFCKEVNACKAEAYLETD